MQDEIGSAAPVRRHRGERIGMAVLALAFIAWAGAFVRTSSFVSSDGVRRYFLFDDSMISMRYAWNLVLSKEAAVLAVQLSGIAFVLVAAYFSSRVVVRIAADDERDATWLRLLVFAATLAYYPLAYCDSRNPTRHRRMGHP